MLSNHKSLIERQVKNTVKKIIKEILKENTENLVSGILNEIEAEIDSYKKFYTVLLNVLDNLRKKLFKKMKEIELEIKEDQSERGKRSLAGQLTEEDQKLFEKEYQTMNFLAKVDGLLFYVRNYELEDGYIDRAFNKLSTRINNRLETSVFSNKEKIKGFVFDPKDSESIYTIIRLFKAQKEGYEPGSSIRSALERFEEARETFNIKMKEIESESEFEDIKEKNINFEGFINQIYLSLNNIVENIKKLKEKSDSTLDIESIKTKSTPSDSMSNARDFKPYRFYEQTKRNKKINKHIK